LAVEQDGILQALGFEQSKVLWNHLKEAGYINAAGKVQDALKRALRDSTLTVPEPFMA